MKKILLVLILVSISGCTTISTTNYIAANHPYEKKFLKSYDETLEAINKILVKDGWQIDGTSSPTVFERQAQDGVDTKSLVVFTKVRKSSWLLFSTYTHLNVFIYSKNDESEVEIRYASIVSWPFKQFHRYRNDGLTDRLFHYLETELALKYSATSR